MVSLGKLGDELRRVRVRCQRLKRQAGTAANTVAWHRWSAAVDRLEGLFTQIATMPVTNLQDVSIRYWALGWEVLDGDLIVEQGARRRVAALGRELRRLAGEQRAWSGSIQTGSPLGARIRG